MGFKFQIGRAVQCEFPSGVERGVVIARCEDDSGRRYRVRGKGTEFNAPESALEALTAEPVTAESPASPQPQPTAEPAGYLSLQVTIVDPRHPVTGELLKLLGFAYEGGRYRKSLSGERDLMLAPTDVGCWLLWIVQGPTSMRSVNLKRGRLTIGEVAQLVGIVA